MCPHVTTAGPLLCHRYSSDYYMISLYFYDHFGLLLMLEVYYFNTDSCIVLQIFLFRNIQKCIKKYTKMITKFHNISLHNISV